MRNNFLTVLFLLLAAQVMGQGQVFNIVKEIFPGDSSGTVSSTAVLNGFYYFSARSPEAGGELWKSDGTASGTTMIKDIFPGSGSSNPFAFLQDGNYVYFSAIHPEYGREIWRTDGTEAGTILMADVNPGTANSNPTNFIACGPWVYFVATNPETGTEIFRLRKDTPGSFELGAELVPGPTSGLVNFADFVSIGDRIYFIVVAVSGGPLNLKFYEINTTTNELRQFTNYNIATDLCVIGNTLYFGARNLENRLGLWKKEGNSEPELVRLFGVPGGNFGRITMLTNCNGLLYFNAPLGGLTSPANEEPWVSDGTEAGTYMLKDINPGPGNSLPSQFVFSGGKVFFSATNTLTGTTGNYELWVTDGTEAGTQMIEINPGIGESRPTGMVAVPGGRVLFFANDGSSGFEVWESDGTVSGTRIVQDINPLGNAFTPLTVFLAARPMDYFIIPLRGVYTFFANTGTIGSQLHFGRLPYYVNDNSTAGDVFTTAIGNNSNPGTKSAPFATLQHAVSVAPEGSVIYVDAGSYTISDITLSKSLRIVGPNEIISPNNSSNPELINELRNPEAIVSGGSILINASDISIAGVQFQPGSKSAITATPGPLQNITIENCLFEVASEANGVVTLLLPGMPSNHLQAGNYIIRHNRFDKKDAFTGTNIQVRDMQNLLIEGNSMVVSGTTNRTQTGMVLTTLAPPNTGRVLNATIQNNHFQNFATAIQIPGVSQSLIQHNTLINGVGGIHFNYDRTNINDVSITDNTLENILGIAISLRGLPNNRRIENIRIQRNHIKKDVGIYLTEPISYRTPQISVDLHACPQRHGDMAITDNTIDISGDFGGGLSRVNHGIQVSGQLNRVDILNNDVLFTATGVIPFNDNIINVPTGIHVATGFINYGPIPTYAVLHIEHNKVSGFHNAVAFYDQNPLPGNTTAKGYGFLTSGAQAFVNFNSLASQSLNINNGETSQVIDGNCNYHGAADAETVFGKITPATVNLSQWLTNGTDANPDAIGFQPLPDVCNGSIAPLTATLSTQQNIRCAGETNGAVQVTVGGGLTPYTYSWTKTGDAAFSADAKDLSNLSAGIYNLTVTDRLGSTANLSVTIAEPALLQATVSGTNVTCANLSNGTATISATGGTAPYSFVWSNGASSATINNLAPGVYSVTATDANGCTATGSYTVINQPAISIVATTVTGTCAGSSNGTVDITATGGTGRLSYAWTGPNGFTFGREDLTRVAAGSYTVVVTDASGCSASLTIEVPATATLVLSATPAPVTCFGTLTGAIDLTVSGGSGSGYSFAWSGPNGFKSSSEDISGLRAGTYTVTVTDPGGCSATQAVTVTQPAAALAVTAVKTDIAACDALGTITATATGGTAPYQFSINGGALQTTNSFASLAVGTYTIQVTDSRGCTATTSVSILDNGSDAFEANNTIAASAAINVGTPIRARLSASRGTDIDWFRFTTGAAGTYSITWSHSSVSQSFDLNTLNRNKAALVTPAAVTANSKIYNLAANTTYYIQVSGTQSPVCYELAVAAGTAGGRGAAPQVKEPVVVQPVQQVLKAAAYPNPHNGSFRLRIESPVSGEGTIQLFDLSGRALGVRKVLFNKGENMIRFDGQQPVHLIYRVSVAGHEASGKILGIR